MTDKPLLKSGTWKDIFLPAASIFIATTLCYSRLISRNVLGNFTHIIKWDIYDFTYPALMFNSDCIRNFIFPLWNPYVYAGKPWISNPQVCLFHPLNALFILFKGYSLELLQFQVFLTFLIAGFSMYFCLNSFRISKTASLVGSISYLSCGFFVGNAQHFPHINIMALFPLSIMCLNRILARPGLRKAAAGSLILTLLVFCGYPLLFIICLYVLLAYSAARLFFIDRNLSGHAAKKIIFYLFIFFMLGIAASAVSLIPAYENFLLSTRSGVSDLSRAGYNSLSVSNFGSMWYPFLAKMNYYPSHKDICLINCSIGIVGLFFAVYYLFFSKDRLRIVLSSFLTASFIMALGTNTPLYAFLCNVVPFIKHSGHPALEYRAIFLFMCCLCAGLGVQVFLGDRNQGLRRSRTAFVFFLLAGILIGCYFKFIHPGSLFAVLLRNNKFIFVSLGFLLLLAVLFPKRMPARYLCAALILFCVIDVSHWTRVNFKTIADLDEGGFWRYVKKRESVRNIGFNKSMELKRHAATDYPASTGDNFAMVFKYFTSGGYDPLILRHYDEIFKSRHRDIITDDFRVFPVYRVKFFSDEKGVVSAINDAPDLRRIALINKKDIRGKGLLKKLKNLSFDKKGEFLSRIDDYKPNAIRYTIRNSMPTLVFFNEIYYPGWYLYSDSNRIELFKINHAFRGAYLDAGEHRLRMIFCPLSYKLGFTISFFSVLLIFFFIFNTKRPIAKNGLDRKAEF